jgi:S-adenosylmethionine:diacylglycerol 3-amino-3-carboxypropyl transferase
VFGYEIVWWRAAEISEVQNRAYKQIRNEFAFGNAKRVEIREIGHGFT